MNRQALKLILFALLINFSAVNAQTKREIKDRFYEAESWMLFEDYKEALPIYQELLEMFPDNYNYRYRIGVCYINTPGEKEKSLDFLQEAVLNINPKYKEGKYKEIGAPYDALFYLGTAYRISNQLDKAIETYENFFEGMDHSLYDSTIIKLQIEACHNAKYLKDVALFLKLTNQGEYINDRFFDINPVVSEDENTIVFSRELQFQTGIFYSKKVNGEWGPAIQIQDQLLVDDGFPTYLSYDGNSLYLYRDENYDGAIYFSNYDNGRWNPAVKLNDFINTKYWESHACVSRDGNTLYFTSNRKDTYGGLDIYVSERDSLGEWGSARNLGPTINTPFNEETPFLDRTDKVLYFSSRGHFNMGGHDIFYSTKLNNEWSAPVNMGYPVNTTDDDIFFSIVGDGHFAYVSQFDPDGYGGKDIFRVEVFSDDHPRKFFVRGIVKLKDLMEQFSDSVKISALNRSNLDTLIVVYSDPHTGEYEFEIPQGEFSVVYESDGSEKIATDLDLELTHPDDMILVPDRELSKTDFIADILLTEKLDSITFNQGDSALLEFQIEPHSILVVEHWQGDSLIKTEEFYINDPLFSYKAETLVGENNLVFTIKDRFNNTSIKNVHISVAEPIVEEPEIIEAITTPDPAILIAQQRSLDSLKAIQDKEAETIVKMDQLISEVTDSDEASKLREAIEKTNEKKIQNAGEWLESLYSVAIEDGAEKELLTALIAAMTAGIDDSAEEYLKKLSEFAGENLLNAIKNIDLSQLDSTDPEDIINYLLSNASKLGYTKDEVFEAFAKLIKDSEKSAQDIVNYIDRKDGRSLWGLWILLGGVIIAFIIFGIKRRKSKK